MEKIDGIVALIMGGLTAVSVVPLPTSVYDDERRDLFI